MTIELPYDYTPRSYQTPIWNHFVPDPYRKEADIIAHRRWGKDLLMVNIASFLSQMRVGTYWHVLPFQTQARAVVWNGMDKAGRKFQDYFHPKLVSHRNESEMRVHFHNGSIWQAIGGDNIDRHVGTNPIGVVLSEWALLDPRVNDYLSPILQQNDGWCARITTIRGKNHAYKNFKRMENLMGKNPRYLAVNQTVDDTKDERGNPIFGPEMIQEERDKGRSEQFIRQEYYNDPEMPLDGTYYLGEMVAARKDGRICSIPYDPKIPVDTYWDIGFSDFTVILFVQEVGLERRIIDVYANSGEEVGHYAAKLREKDYSYGRHYGPWDLEIKQLAAGGKSVYDVAKMQGIKFIVTPQPKMVGDGIEQVRNIFPTVWFDGKRCERLIEALSSYRKELLADKLQQTGAEDGQKVYKDKPLHDWSSHYCLSIDTAILTKRGTVALADVKVGDEVALGDKYAKVLGNNDNGIKDTLVVVFGDGTYLEGTKEHKVFTTGGLRLLGDLAYGDLVLTNKTLCKNNQLIGSGAGLRENFIEITEGLGIGIGHSGNFTCPKKAGCNQSFTGLFGKAGTESFRRIGRFIQSAQWRTSQMLTGECGFATVGGFRSSNINRRNFTASDSHLSRVDTIRDTTAPKASDTCTAMFGRITTVPYRKVTRFITRTKTSPTTTSQTCSSSTFQNIGVATPSETGWGQKTRSILKRLGLLPLLGTGAKKVELGTDNMLKRVVSVEPSGRMVPVRDLTIEKDHAYIANGVLVSNCDAMRIMAWHARKRRPKDEKLQEFAEDSYRYV